MSARFSAWADKHALVLYFLLAYAFTWAIEIPIALAIRGVIAADFPLAIHYLASFGPALAALIVALLTRGLPGVAGLYASLAKWRLGRGYALFAVLSPPALFALAVLVYRLVQGAWPDLRLLGEADYLPYLGVLPALGLWLLTFGLGEETGWRGCALPRLQANRSALSASLLLGLLWAGWHLPALFYRDTYNALGLLLGVLMLLVGVLTASVVITWLYNGTGGSLLVVVLFHGLFNFFSVSEAGGDYAAILMTAVLVFWAVRIVNVYDHSSLSPAGKQEILSASHS